MSDLMPILPGKEYDQALRILHLEDSLRDAELIREHLSTAGFSLHLDWATNERDFSAHLKRGSYDLVLADYQLPNFEAPAALALTRSLCPGLPFIVVSGAVGEEKAVELLKHGATDYVLKDRLDKLSLAIRRALDEVKENRARHKAEEALQQLNEELEQRVTERTVELETAYNELKIAQSRILHQEKMASIGQLAAGVAHEINNPLGFLLSNLRTLDRYTDRLVEFILTQTAVLQRAAALLPELGPELLAEIELAETKVKLKRILPDIKELLAESVEGGERMKQIVINLKSFVRLDEKEKQSADLNEGLESTLNIVWNELKYKAKVKKAYGELPQIECNLGQLNQVFMNLLINAAQAIETQGEINITTSCENDNLFIVIEDTGCGIPPERLSRIFEPFFTSKEVGKGTGLGLSIAYDIVKSHNGEINVESEVGRGSRFTVRLPVRQGI